jgi:hypothetical protein
MKVGILVTEIGKVTDEPIANTLCDRLLRAPQIT